MVHLLKPSTYINNSIDLKIPFMFLYFANRRSCKNNTSYIYNPSRNTKRTSHTTLILVYTIAERIEYPVWKSF